MAIHPDAPEAVDPLEIGRLRDPHGVLTIYVDADPREQAAARPSWVVATENGLREIRERVKSQGDRALWTAVFDRLGELEPEISTLLDPRRPGRGRALFATIDGGVLRTAGLHLPLANRVVLDDIAHLTPLVSALDRGRPVGILAVSHTNVRVLERRLGLVDEVTAVSLEPDTSEWREMKGPAAANPALAQHAAPQHDRFERRLEEHRVQALEAATSSLEGLSARRGWDSILVAGDRRLAERLAVAMSRERMDVAVVDRSLGMLTPGDIVAAVAPELEAAAVRREELLVTRVRDAALSGNAGAVGLADVLTALDEGPWITFCSTRIAPTRVPGRRTAVSFRRGWCRPASRQRSSCRFPRSPGIWRSERSRPTLGSRRSRRHRRRRSPSTTASRRCCAGRCRSRPRPRRSGRSRPWTPSSVSLPMTQG